MDSRIVVIAEDTLSELQNQVNRHLKLIDGNLIDVVFNFSHSIISKKGYNANGRCGVHCEGKDYQAIIIFNSNVDKLGL